MPEEATDAGAEPVKVLFCGDRAVSAQIVRLMREEGAEIVGLGLNSPPSPFTPALRQAAGVDPSRVFFGRSFSSDLALELFRALAPDLGVCCGFAGILRTPMLRLPRWGWVNFHRSYLPYNRGLDPLQWALVEGTPAGVSVHVMVPQVDAGPVITQAEMPIWPTDDYDALERRSDELVLELFRTAWPRLRAGDVKGTPQDESRATYHSLADCDALRRLDLDATMKVGRLLNILRGYSGQWGSAIEFQVGLLRTRFTVHTQVRMMAEVPVTTHQPADTDTPQDPDSVSADSVSADLAPADSSHANATPTFLEPGA